MIAANGTFITLFGEQAKVRTTGVSWIPPQSIPNKKYVITQASCSNLLDINNQELDLLSRGGYNAEAVKTVIEDLNAQQAQVGYNTKKLKNLGCLIIFLIILGSLIVFPIFYMLCLIPSRINGFLKKRAELRQAAVTYIKKANDNLSHSGLYITIPDNYPEWIEINIIANDQTNAMNTGVMNIQMMNQGMMMNNNGMNPYGNQMMYPNNQMMYQNNQFVNQGNQLTPILNVKMPEK